MSDKPNLERRATSCEFRVVPSESPREPDRLVGYAAVFDTPTSAAGAFTEVIRPGAFARALGEGVDIRATFHHDAKILLGRTSSGTLRVEEDDVGLRYEVDLPETQAARDVAHLVERGDLRGSSFGFYLRSPNGEKWTFDDDGDAFRELVDLVPFDVGPTADPAYSETSVALRSLEAVRDELAAEAVSAARADQERRELSIGDAEAKIALREAELDDEPPARP